ncbi:MAG: peptidylprolyl isomerase [Candidatus Saganbacteria bacterium]|nr:peptidylprolyl isomerase [Candidatus Saganbacteria bacterium]
MAKSQKVPSVGRLKKIVQRSGGNWNSLKKAIKEDLLVQKLISKKNKEVKVSPNDLREINVRHILIRHQKGKEEDVEERVKRIFVKARGGEDFAKLAKKYSEDPGSKVKGGDLGYFTTGAMVPPFEEAAFKLKIREISQPIKTDFGYHIIKLENSRLRKISGQKDIEKAIMQEKQQKFFSDWMFNLKKDTKIKIIDASLRALDLRLKGKLNEAVFEYNKAIAENPGNAYPHIFLASLYEELDKNELAVSEYKAAIDLSSGDPTFYILLGDLLVKMNNKSAAIKQYKKASIIAGDKKMIHEELVTKFKKLRSNANVQKELQEISRISKKEAFEKGLLDKQQKLKTE